MSVLGVQTVGRAGRCAQGLIWRIDTMSGVGAWGNVGETMRGLSRTDLPRLHPAPSAAAVPQGRRAQKYERCPFFSVDKADDKEAENFTSEFGAQREIA